MDLFDNLASLTLCATELPALRSRLNVRPLSNHLAIEAEGTLRSLLLLTAEAMSPKLRVKMRLRLSTASNRDLRRSWGCRVKTNQKVSGCVLVEKAIMLWTRM